jgi:choline transport protein
MGRHYRLHSHVVPDAVVVRTRSWCSFPPSYLQSKLSSLLGCVFILHLLTPPKQLEPRTSIPMVAVGVVTVIPALLALIHIGSPVVFNDVVSLSVTGFYSSYFLPSALLLWRRTTGHIAEPNDPGSEDIAADAPEGFEGEKVLQMQLVWGPWRVPGLLGIINNAFACIYMIFVIFWSSWPPATPVTAETMNYSVVVTVGVITLSIIYYFLYGKRHYIGPLVDPELLGEAGLERAAVRTE